MKYLRYTTYCSGQSGLSNGIMSVEVGVILAFLMNRVLVLDGNRTPPANIVPYPGIITNRYPSKITDLWDLPIPWVNAEEIDLSHLNSQEFTHHQLMKSVLYYPSTLDIATEDFHHFARGRKRFLTYTRDQEDATVLTMPGGPEVGPQKYHMANLSFYSYLFYCDDPTKSAIQRMLQSLRPKQPYENFALQVAQELGTFNATHIRRGDFKKTYGVTTIERMPREALDVLEHHFSQDHPLVILTDEMRDPFFHDIRASYTNSLFLDQFILDNFREAFLDLPCHDSIALACVSQLVASQSTDFIGSMNSTFTSLIQRYRGNNGKDERFKFLWNELPDEGDVLERGHHPKSLCVPMQHGVMVEEFQGPYSWNRYNQRINPAWMREWPESFLPPRENSRETTQQDGHTSACSEHHRGSHSKEHAKGAHAFPDLVSFQGMALTKYDQAWIFIGTPDENMHLLIGGLQEKGWGILAEEQVSLNLKLRMLELRTGIGDPKFMPIRKVILTDYSPQSPTQLVKISPAANVGNLLSFCAGPNNDYDLIIPSLCNWVHHAPISRLSYSSAQAGSQVAIQAYDQTLGTDTPFSNLKRNPMTQSIQTGPSKTITVQIFLAGGHQLTASLPTTSPILESLYMAMGAKEQSSSISTPTFFQVPLDEGNHVCSFSSEQLVCVVTEPQEKSSSSPPISQPEPYEILPSKYVQIDNFFTPYEKNRLLAFALQHESQLTPSQVTTTDKGALHDPTYRKSHVLGSFKDSEFSDIFTNRIRTHLLDLGQEFAVSSYSIKEIEAQLTASNDGDFFKLHNDNGSRSTASRELTYVYYFYRDPKPFAGGELILYDTKVEPHGSSKADSFSTIEPRNNSIVFFLSGCMHEVLPVRCPSKIFGDSRFTINGWVRRQRMLPPTQLPDSIQSWARTIALPKQASV